MMQNLIDWFYGLLFGKEIKIKTSKRKTYETVIGEIINIDGERFRCTENIFTMSASGSYCSECDFHEVVPSNGHIESFCCLPSGHNFKCHAYDRTDKTNIIFRMVK